MEILNVGFYLLIVLCLLAALYWSFEHSIDDD